MYNCHRECAPLEEVLLVTRKVETEANPAVTPRTVTYEKLRYDVTNENSVVVLGGTDFLPVWGVESRNLQPNNLVILPQMRGPNM